MKTVPAWVTYTVLRLLLIAVPLVILLLLQVPWWLSAIIAAVVGLCLSYLLLGNSRDKVSSEIYAARKRKATVLADDEVEDSVVDASAGESEHESDASQEAASSDAASTDAASQRATSSEAEREPEGQPVRESRDHGQLKG